MLLEKTTTIHCVHGDNVRLREFDAEVANNLPTSVPLGVDVPVLGRPLGLKPKSRQNKMQRALLVVTRNPATRQAQERRRDVRKTLTQVHVSSSSVTLDAQSTDEENAGSF